MLASHFCLENEDLKRLGRKVLDLIFSNPPTKVVRHALAKLATEKRTLLKKLKNLSNWCLKKQNWIKLS